MLSVRPFDPRTTAMDCGGFEDRRRGSFRSQPTAGSGGQHPPMRHFSAISYHFLAKDALLIEQGGICLVFVGFMAICDRYRQDTFRMKIRVGFEMLYEFPQPTPMIMVLGTHFTRASDVIVPDFL